MLQSADTIEKSWRKKLGETEFARREALVEQIRPELEAAAGFSRPVDETGNARVDGMAPDGGPGEYLDTEENNWFEPVFCLGRFRQIVMSMENPEPFLAAPLARKKAFVAHLITKGMMI